MTCEWPAICLSITALPSQRIGSRSQEVCSCSRLLRSDLRWICDLSAIATAMIPPIAIAQTHRKCRLTMEMRQVESRFNWNSSCSISFCLILFERGRQIIYSWVGFTVIARCVCDLFFVISTRVQKIAPNFGPITPKSVTFLHKFPARASSSETGIFYLYALVTS